MKQAMESVPARLTDLVGAEHVLTGAAELSACEVDGLRPSAVVRPGATAEIAEILGLASAERLAVIPMGGRTKLGIGMPPSRYDLALDLTRMDRVLAFDPADLTLGVEPGVRFAQLEQELAAKRQFLPLASAFAERATLGGMIAAGVDSPLRHAYGSARDQLLGMEFVTAAGVIAKSGGRVVKNVTGYDMHQLLAGSLGTLAVITRLNFRTSPMPPQERMFVAAFPEAQGRWDSAAPSANRSCSREWWKRSILPLRRFCAAPGFRWITGQWQSRLRDTARWLRAMSRISRAWHWSCTPAISPLLMGRIRTPCLPRCASFRGWLSKPFPQRQSSGCRSCPVRYLSCCAKLRR